MSEMETPSTPKPPRARKPRRKRRPAVKPPADPKKPDPFAGLTANECPAGCRATGCVITGNARCGHPRKGGLQGREMHDYAVVERFAEARKKLLHASIDKRTA